MSPIDQYLDGLERRLFVRRRARREMLEEMHGHIEALEAARGAAFPDAEAIAAAFGSQPALARRINAAVPWRQAQLPWRLLLVGLAAAVLIDFALWPVLILIVNHLNQDGMIGIVCVAAYGCCSQLGLFGGSLMAMVYSARVDARPLHRWIAMLAPCVFAAYDAITRLAGALRYPEEWRLLLNHVMWDASIITLCALIACIATRPSWSRLRARVWMLSVVAATIGLNAVLSMLSAAPLDYGTPLGFLLASMLLAWLAPILARRADADRVTA